MAAALESRPSLAAHDHTASTECCDMVIEQIARSTGNPVAVVQEIYERTLESLTSEATITQFVGVIATRRVMLELRGR